MSLEFRSLPQYVVQRIFTLLDLKTRLRMREVCKSTRNIVDSSILSYQKTVVNVFKINSYSFTEFKRTSTCARLSFRLNERRDYSIWRICLKSLFAKLRIAKQVLQGKDGTMLNAILRLDQVKRLLEYLQPQTRRTQFDDLIISFDNSRIIGMIDDFVNGKYISTVALDDCHSKCHNWHPLLKLVKHVKPDKLRYISSFAKDCGEFLKNVANYVNEIFVHMALDGHMRTNIASLIQEIFRRKCRQLEFAHPYCMNLITFAEAEKLIQAFHHLEKKIILSACTDAQPLSIQLGVYGVKIRNFLSGRKISIEHV